ncbi:MAG: AmmeMemoRadiSam system protein B, partial [Deltaproteobacteria bacterium]|nr:AmmeMemoRadiSam system protein B [Deltaproteobacteria bacterium]
LGHESDLADRVSVALDPLIDQNTLLVVSSDLSHYLSYQKAVARDQETIKMILNLNAGKLLTRENAACGRIPILVAINMARRHGYRFFSTIQTAETPQEIAHGLSAMRPSLFLEVHPCKTIVIPLSL